MRDAQAIYDQVYGKGDLFGVEHELNANPLTETHGTVRPNSIAIQGAGFGDEGKGKCVDELCTRYARDCGRVLAYRWNGGAGAGHTVVFGGASIALHQIPSGVFHREATVVLGKGMAIHPGDLLTEIDQVAARAGGDLPAQFWIDELAILSLDTHRGFEAQLKRWAEGGRGSTGRGMAPAYADVLLRHPVRMRDLVAADWATRLGRHYDLYAAIIGGLGGYLASTTVPQLAGGPIEVGSRSVFLERLAVVRQRLQPYTRDILPLVQEAWADSDYPFVFEGAQASGLDARWGVYPDVTASDTTFAGILHSTSGVVRPEDIAVKAGVIKATYMSSVGTRKLPTLMEGPLAQRIREDAWEYGATTHRPRDIAYLDLPCLSFLAHVTGTDYLALTHLDVAYADTPIRVCTHYTDQSGATVAYRPDQEYLNAVMPHYVQVDSWDGGEVRGARKVQELPRAAHQLIALLSQTMDAFPVMGTNGPERDALLSWLPQG
jgi:adenylosuccinate synthase